MDIPQAVIDDKLRQFKLMSEGFRKSVTATPTKEQREPINDVPTDVTVNGKQISVEGEPFTVKGVGYQPTPIGEYSHDLYTLEHQSLWTRDLQHLRDMNCNVIRIWGWDPDPPLENNHQAFLDACYNNGEKPIYVIAALWVDANVKDSGDRQKYIQDFTKMVNIHKNHPAILMWAFGNEVNFMLPEADKQYFYTLLNEAAQAAHTEEGAFHHPVTTANGEVADIATAELNNWVPDLDVWGVNVYKGVVHRSPEKDFMNFFEEYAAASEKPMVVTEHGIDALNNQAVPPPQEYESVQADYDGEEWDQIKANSSVCSGGCIMAYSDEWWKDPKIVGGDPSNHNYGGWPNNGPDLFSNEEWYGIMRIFQGTPNLIERRPVYYTMQGKWAEAEPPKVSSLSIPWFVDTKK